MNRAVRSSRWSHESVGERFVTSVRQSLWVPGISAPVFDGAPRAAKRTFPAMITISIGLGLNQLRLHRGENGLALGQAQPNGLRGNHICRPVVGDHFASLNAPGGFC